MTKLDFGSFVLGGNVFGWTVEREEGFRILDVFVDRGGRMIDTADAYPPGGEGGGSEAMIGEWIASRGQRDRVAIATKVAKWPKQRGLSAANITSAIEGSLRRLRTDHVDLYYAHEDDPNVEQSEYVAAFDRLVREGKVHALGASNFTPERLHSALEVARTHGLRGFEVSQDHWNLVERKLERTLLPVIEREGLKELPYYSLASGFLTGKYRPGRSAASARASRASKYLDDPRNVKLLSALDELAGHHSASVAGVALAWLRAHAVVAAPIASARTVDQLDSLFEAGTIKLAPVEVAKLSAITS
ncbi:MAG TPA: aldo/keto reductase [Kofleriaceae bacterium]|nr:aldo/keto reductase [Kofleriaceae bacterium]